MPYESFSETSLSVALTPGCEMLWTVSNTKGLKSGGTMARARPVEISQRSSGPLSCNLPLVICKLVSALLYACTSALEVCAIAVAGQSMPNETALISLSVTACETHSATTFFFPDMCLMSVENSEIADRCLCWQADCKSVVFYIAWTKGLWSV